VEEQFYLLLPILVRHATPRALLVAIGGLFGLGMASKIVVLLAGLPSIAAWVLLPPRLDAFMAGALVSVVIRQQGASRRRPAEAIGFAVAIGGAAIYGALTVLPDQVNLLVRGGSSLLALAFAGLVWVAAGGGQSLIVRILEHSALRWLGTVSYCAYLIHQPVNGAVHALVLGQAPKVGSPAELTLTLGSLTIVLSVCWLSWRFLEAPLIRLGKRLTEAPPGHTQSSENPH
jgi:peptidoglycan/LPS O-acetylase OafA/YrhL